jgi:hypothetical protein
LNILAGFADISPAQLVLVGGMALLASVIGGLAGYGTGALMPLVLVPLVGASLSCRSSRSRRFSPISAASWRIFATPTGGAR